jgi:hypothetical protein
VHRSGTRASARAAAKAAAKTKKPRANELTLAGLRPGRDTRSEALARYHKPWSGGDTPEVENGTTALWRDLCRSREVRMDFGANNVIESITISVIAGPIYDCAAGAPILPADTWRTGRGLALGELRNRVLAVYGEPESHGPSSEQGEESEFLYYAFDWAGSEVPQVLEVTCDKKTGRIIQITLAAQSL